ncbi:MAG: hypothetical protein ABRQ26_08010 [Syntrophomonadaceae bacterium]
MKKKLTVLVALSLFLAAFILEGGRLASLFIGTALVPMFLGPVLSACFSFSLADIKNAFNDAFAERLDLNRTAEYQTGLQVVNNLQNAVIWWAFSIVVLAMIMILSSVTEVRQLGPKVAAGTVALLTGLLLRTLLLNPMEFSLRRKVLLSSDDRNSLL